jgi:hypothetical protein
MLELHQMAVVRDVVEDDVRRWRARHRQRGNIKDLLDVLDAAIEAGVVAHGG